MTNPVDPETGAPLHRDVRPLHPHLQGREHHRGYARLVWRPAG